MFQFDSKIRYSEVDMNQNLTLNGIINYFQDCSTFQSEYIGYGIDYLRQHKKAWVLFSWQIEIEEFPKFGEKISVQTWAYGFKVFYGKRNFVILNEQGKILVKANSLWIYMDTETGKPNKVDEEQQKGYGIDEPLDMEYLSRKITVPQNAIEKEHFSVLKFQLDTNQHVNNGQYIQIAQEYLSDDFRIRRVRAEYKKEAKLYDVIIPWVDKKDKECIVSLCDENRSPYAVIVFEK